MTLGTHVLEDEDTSAQSDTDNHTDDVTDTNFTQWTDNSNCQPTVLVVHKFTGGSSVFMTNRATQHQ